MDAYCDGLERFRRGSPPSETRVPTYLAGFGIIAISPGIISARPASGKACQVCYQLLGSEKKLYFIKGLLSERSEENIFFFFSGKFLNEFLEWLFAFPPVRLLSKRNIPFPNNSNSAHFAFLCIFCCARWHDMNAIVWPLPSRKYPPTRVTPSAALLIHPARQTLTLQGVQ